MLPLKQVTLIFLSSSHRSYQFINMRQTVQCVRRTMPRVYDTTHSIYIVRSIQNKWQTQISIITIFISCSTVCMCSAARINATVHWKNPSQKGSY